MATTKCSDCGHEVSTSAMSCPGCGAPKKATCPRCGAQAVEKVDGLKGARENIAGLLLIGLLLIPGIAYYFDRTRLPFCTSCKHRVPKGALVILAQRTGMERGGL